MTVKWLIVPLVFMLLKYGQTEGTDPCVNVNITQETALNGSDVILKCFLKPPINADHDILEWKKGESEIYIIRRSHGQTYGPYKDRASVPFEEFKKGNASLKLSGVTESDKGQYCCCINRGNVQPRECTTVNLIVRSKDMAEDTEEHCLRDREETCSRRSKPDSSHDVISEEDKKKKEESKENKGGRTEPIAWILSVGLICALGICAGLVLAAGVGYIFYKRRHQILNFIQHVRYIAAPVQQPAL